MVRQIEDRPIAMIGDMLHRLLKLITAVTALAAEDVPGMADGVKADQGMVCTMEITMDKHAGLLQLRQVGGRQFDDNPLKILGHLITIQPAVPFELGGIPH
ncbi:hypothetical protein D3C73_980430 [compost metagenome]